EATHLVEVLGDAGTTGSIAQLALAVALDQEHPARSQRPLEALEQRGAQFRAGELDEDGDHRIEGIGFERPSGGVGNQQLELHATACRQCARLLDRNRRDVEGSDIKTRLGEEYAIAGLAIGDAQHLAAGGQQPVMRGQPRVRLFAEKQAFGAGESSVPGVVRVIEFAHDRFYPAGESPHQRRKPAGRAKRRSGLIACSRSSCSRNSSGSASSPRTVNCRMTAAKSPGVSSSSRARRIAISGSSAAASPSSASAMNMRSRWPESSGRKRSLKAKRRKAASSMRSNRFVVQMNTPSKRSMPWSISLTSLTS